MWSLKLPCPPDGSPLTAKNVFVHSDALPYVFENVLSLGTDYDVRISARQQFHVPPGMQKTKQKTNTIHQSRDEFTNFSFNEI